MFHWFGNIWKFKVWRVVIIFIIVVGLSAGGYYGVYINNFKTTTTTNTVQYYTVERGDITETLTISGNLSYYNVSYLTFNTAGTIGSVNVTAGDSVTEGAVLATFDDSSMRALQIAVLEAEAALAEAQEYLQSIEYPYSAAEINAAEKNVTEDQIALNEAQTNLDNIEHPYNEIELAEAELAVTKAEIAVATAETNLYNVEHPYTDAEISAAEQKLENAIANETIINQKGELQIDEAEDALSSAIEEYNKVNSSDNYNAVKQAKVNLAAVKQSVAEANEAAETAVTNAQETLDAMTADPDPLYVQQAEQELLVAQLNLSAAESNLADMQEATDSLTILLAQQALVVAQDKLAEDEQTLAEMQVGTDAIIIQLAQLDVENAQNTLALAQEAEADNEIVATSSGTITAVNIEVGDKVTADTVAIETTDKSKFALTASVDELDIPLVALGQSATISIDALSDQTFKGEVSNIAYTSTTSQGVVSYQVTVTVEDPSGNALISGMSASADIVTESATNVLIIPSDIIGGTTSNPTVVVLADGLEQTVSITIGISNDNYTEVTSGLNEGDKIVTSDYNGNIVTTTKSVVNTQTMPYDFTNTDMPIMTGTDRPTMTGTIDFPGGSNEGGSGGPPDSGS
jgi:HlyD family secretion protein